MAESLDALNFNAIIDDKEFKASVDRIIGEAQRLNTDVSKILTFNAKIQSKQIITSQGVKNAEAMVGHLKDIEEKMTSLSGKKLLVGDADALNETLQKVLEKMDDFSDKSEKSKGSIKGINNELNKSQGLMQTLAQLTGVTFGLAGIRSFLSGLVRVTGEFEVQKMALTSMLQDAGKAEEIFSTLRQKALESPYTFQDLTKYAKQLTAFNIDADKLVETEKRLADVSAGLGVDMGRIILAYGQVKAAGVLKGTELRQFTEAGVPLLQSLADQIQEVEGKTISLSEVFSRISKKQIPFEMVEEAFRRMTDEGGKFYNMQEVLVNTLQGKIGKLRDVWQQMLYDMGSSNDTLKWSVDLLTRLVSNFDKIAKTIAPLVAAWGTYKVALAACVSIQKALLGAETIAGMLKLTKATSALGTAMKAVKAGAMGISAAVGVIALLVTTVSLVASKMKKAREEQEKYNNAVANCTRLISDEFDNLDRLKKVAEDEKRSMVERKNAIDTINQQYGSYLSNMGQEKVSVDNLTTSYNNLREAIANKFLDELKEQTVGAERTNKNNAENALLQYNIGLIKKAVGGEPRRLARLTAEVQKYLSNIAPNSNQENIYKKLSDIYSKEGLNIEDDSAKIYKLAENYVNASERLKNSEKNFDSFADEYTKSWGTVRKTNDGVTKQDDLTPSVWGDNKGKDNKAIQRAKDDINTTIDSIKDLQRAYKDFKEMGLDDESILNLFGNDDMFGYLDKNLRTRLDFWDMLLEQADKMERYDENDAQRIRADVARGKADEAKQAWKDEQKELEKSKKAREEYEKALAKWNAKAKEYSGVGFEYDATKIIEDYKSELEKLDVQYEEYVELAKEAGLATDAFDEGLVKLKNTAKATAQDKLNGLADSYMKEALAAHGIDLSNLSDKSLRQLREMKEEIQQIASSVLEIDSADLSTLEQFGIDINNISEGDMDVIEFLREEGVLLDENTVATLKLMMASQKLDLSFDGLKSAIKDLLQNGLQKMSSESKEKLAKAVKYFAKEVVGLADSFVELGEAIDNPKIQNAGETLKGLGDLASSVSQGFSQAGPLGGAISLMLWSAKNIVSDMANDAKKTAEAIDMMNDAERRYNQELDKTAIKSQETIFGKNVLGELREYFSLVKKYRSYINNYWKSESEGGNKETQRLLQAYGLLDNDGNLIIDKIKAAIESGIIGGETAKDLEDAINTYKDAVDGINDIAESMVGSVISDVADKLVDSWWEAGQAALDYADILEDVAKGYAKLVVQDMLMSAAFDDERRKQFIDALKSGDAETAMATVASAMQAAQDMLPSVEQALQVFEPYRNPSGVGDESSSVGSGVKSITEDTANLLASYINAMRADLSIMRGLQEKGWGYIESFGASLPTLNDYIAQIAATNFDIAQSNQSILSEIQSVIGAPGTSGMVVRVEAS